MEQSPFEADSHAVNHFLSFMELMGLYVLLWSVWCPTSNLSY